MSVPVNITNGPDTVEILDGALRVSEFPSEREIIVPVVRPLTVKGDGVTSSLRVDGSVSPVRAFMGADPDGDIYITELNVTILGVTGGSNSLLRDFATIPDGLTNGCVLYRNILGSEVEFREFPLKTNFDWVTIGTLTAPVGADAGAFRLKDVLPGNNSFGYNPRLDMRWVNPPYGLRLKQRSADQIGLIIQDNLTVANVSEFSINAIGFKRLLNTPR